MTEEELLRVIRDLRREVDCAYREGYLDAVNVYAVEHSVNRTMKYRDNCWLELNARDVLKYSWAGADLTIGAVDEKKSSDES